MDTSRSSDLSSYVSVRSRNEDSQAHWSELSESSENSACAEIANVEVFENLQKHPQWGHFFKWYGDGENELVMGAKINEGAQAEIFAAQVTKAGGQVCNLEMVLKVFRHGSFLKDLQSQWPLGLLERQANKFDKYMGSNCAIHCGTLLSDGRFAFLMSKEHCDLRSLIHRRMSHNQQGSPPFSNGLRLEIMWYIADGMATLHRNNLVHRDLKPANVLVNRRYGVACCVADYESSVGVVGTGFFRAPEILQAQRDGDLREVFTKAVDVYSYGMTCYEIFTGKPPFQGHRLSDYDLVLVRRQRPLLPKDVDDWTRELLNRCWEFDPSKRPSFEDICGGLIGRFSTNKNLQEIVELRKKQMW